jgi:hypothetical protein
MGLLLPLCAGASIATRLCAGGPKRRARLLRRDPGFGDVFRCPLPNRVDSWFLIDARTRQTTLFKSEAELARAAGFKLELRPVAKIYDQCRRTPFDDAMRYVLFIPPQLAFALLIWWLKGLRLESGSSSSRRRGA